MKIKSDNIKKSSGFTLVELVVVIAIIGVLTAIIVPLVNNGNPQKEADNRAQAFFFNFQGAITELKQKNPAVETGKGAVITSAADLSPSGVPLTFIAQVDKNGVLEKLDASVSDPPGAQKVPGFSGNSNQIFSGNISDVNSVWKDFVGKLKGTALTPETNVAGFFKVEVDKYYRVSSVKWKATSDFNVTTDKKIVGNYPYI